MRINKERLKFLRIMAGISQSDFPGLTRKTVSKAETGGNINYLTVVKLAEALKVTPEYLTEEGGIV